MRKPTHYLFTLHYITLKVFFCSLGTVIFLVPTAVPSEHYPVAVGVVLRYPVAVGA